MQGLDFRPIRVECKRAGLLEFGGGNIKRSISKRKNLLRMLSVDYASAIAINPPLHREQGLESQRIGIDE